MPELPATSIGLMSWEQFVDQLKPLGARLMDRLPERLRQDPTCVQESYRLLLAGLARGLSDAVVGDRRHPLFVPEISLAQNIFQPNADTVYRCAMIDGAGIYRIRGERGSTRSVLPPETPRVTPAEREAAIRARRIGAQLRGSGDSRPNLARRSNMRQEL